MAAAVQRVPFGEVSAARLQSLQSAKNRQNAITDLLKSPTIDKLSSFKSPVKTSNIQLTTSCKRPASAIDDDNASDSDHNSDAENVDPVALHPAKRVKGEESLSPKPTFSLFQKPSLPFEKSTTSIKRKYTPDSPSSTPLFQSSAVPAGRVFAHPRVSLLSSQKRKSSSTVKRIDPPSSSVIFGKKTNAAIPFSIDAALTGTFAKPATKKTLSLKKAQPSSWFFDIYEDSPDEEAANIMEHSTGLIDISSDDEQGPAIKKQKLDEDKENIAPGDYVQQSRLQRIVPPVSADVMTDNDCDGNRSPLSDLAPEDYFGNGCDKNSVAVLEEEELDDDAEAEVQAETEAKLPEDKSNASPVSSSDNSLDQHQSTMIAADDIDPAHVPLPADTGLDFIIAEDPIDA